MGFGGAAMIAAPLSVWLMSRFSTPTHIGVAETFVVMGLVYACLHAGRRGDRAAAGAGMEARGLRSVDPAQETRHHQRRLRLPGVEDAAVLADLDRAVHERDRGHRRARTGFGDEPGNVPGPRHRRRRRRFRRTSQHLQHGRTLLLGLDVRLTSAARTPISSSSLSASCSMRSCRISAARGNLALFVLCFGVILSMYGGGFATVPAYLRDMFGTRYVGAIHGLLITAWSVAGVLGPVLVNYIRQYQIDSGVPKAQAYNVTMYIMAGLLGRRLHRQFPDQGGRRSPSYGPRDGRRPGWGGLRGWI